MPPSRILIAVIKGRAFNRIGMWAVFAGAALVLLYYGWNLRRWTWDYTAAIHFRSDMDNAWKWGTRAAAEGYFQLYDAVISEHEDGKYGLDYMPLRLAVLTLWAGHEQAMHPNVRRWDASYEFNAPLLRFNALMEFLAAAGVFALTRLWMMRHRSGGALTEQAPDPWLSIEWLALLAFALAWFNPASLLSAHARPTWDVWVAPFYLWAIFAACLNGWFIAGCLVALGMMFKGQQLIVAPVFLLWPMMGLRFGAAFRWLVGFALGLGVLASPWIIPRGSAAMVFVCVMLLTGPALWLRMRRYPVIRERLTLQRLGLMTATTAALALWIGAWMFDGSMGWFRVGIVYGAEKFGGLEMGGASSLASLLQNRFGWKTADHAWTVPGINVKLSISELLIAIYCIGLLLSCLAMRLAERRRDRVFLLAMAAPWIIYFAVFPKMHERYLLWGAIAACTAVGVGLGPTLLAVLLSLCSANMSLLQLLDNRNAAQFMTDVSPTIGRTLKNFTDNTYPDIAWAILVASGAWLYLSFIRTGRRVGAAERSSAAGNSPPAVSDVPAMIDPVPDDAGSAAGVSRIFHT